MDILEKGLILFMKQLGLLRAFFLASRYKKYSPAKRLALQTERLRSLVGYARRNSPYFKDLYASLPDDYQLSDLPPTNKIEMMAHFDDWVTDRSIHLADINTFMQKLDNIGRSFNGSYLVFTTSGSTGNPAVVLYDKKASTVMSAVVGLRAIARKQDLKALMRRGFKAAGVFATGGFYLGNSSVRSRLLQMPWKRRSMMVTSVLNPLPQIVQELNAFQPAMLGGYPTALELLIDEQRAGRLHIKPALIVAGGEFLSDDLRKRLSEAFSCYVQTSYSCTEGGTVACECVHRHFHINDDWLLVEAVDKENRPVPDGVQSDKILLTNLSSYTQPFIRYEITDRIVLHHEPCPCGSTFPWLEIEGRTDDVLSFDVDGKTVRIIPLALYALLKENHAIRRFQLVAHASNQLELRLICKEGENREAVFTQASERLKAYLRDNGINKVEISLSQELPQPHPKSGKFKHIYRAD